MFSLWVSFFSRTPCKLWEGAQWTSHRKPDLARTSSSARDRSHRIEGPQQFLTFSFHPLFPPSPLQLASSLNWPVQSRTGLSRRGRAWQKGTELAAEAGKQKQKWQKNKILKLRRKQDLILPATSRWDAVLLTGERERRRTGIIATLWT